MARGAGRTVVTAVIEGNLGVEIGFDEYTLRAGDSISFESRRRRRLGRGLSLAPLPFTDASDRQVGRG